MDRSSVRLGLPLLACFSMTACASVVPSGARPATSADRSGKVERAYVCESPLTFTVDDDKVFEPSEAEKPDVSGDAVVYAGAGGPVLVDGKNAVTNQWVSGDGEQHFFSWSDAAGGAELVIARHRRSATRLVWAPQPGDPSAYQTKTFPDGTTRPEGVPKLVETCTARDVYDELRKEGRRPFLAVQAMPAPAVTDAKARTLAMRGCQRPGQEPTTNGSKVPDWLWSPYQVLISDGATPTAYLSFQRPSDDRMAVWAVPVAADGHFGAQMGAVRYQGNLVPGATMSVRLTSEVTTLPNATLDCSYGTR
jgi:hypothetical protein